MATNQEKYLKGKVSLILSVTSANFRESLSSPMTYLVFSSGDNYILSMRFLDHVFDDMVVDEMTLKIILPEGAK